MKRAVWVVGLGVGLALSGQAVTACVGDDPPPSVPDAGAEAGPANGATCADGSECASGVCADGVCCDTACGGTCESCNLPGLAGTCSPVPSGQDPERECAPQPMADAGAPDPDAGDDDAGDAAVFTLPEGGVTVEDNQCAGSCNGQRACAYPGPERTCGSVFCGNTTTEGRASCDSAGHCVFGVQECSAYACPDGSLGCKASCTAESDCLPTHFCDATTSTCKPKLANGSGCQSVAQCQSGFCANDVCCNDVCTGYPGAACDVAGHVGECTCDACPGKTCKLYYQDLDGDGFGNKDGDFDKGTAKPGCAAGPAPAGFVDNKLDCYDAANVTAGKVHPGQTGWFTEAYTIPGGVPSYDYNCNGATEKEWPEHPGATCAFCKYDPANGGGFFPVGGNCKRPTSCDAAGSKGAFSCVPGKLGFGCQAGDVTSFRTTVACGGSNTLYTCSACSAVGGGTSMSSMPGKSQGCH